MTMHGGPEVRGLPLLCLLATLAAWPRPVSANNWQQSRLAIVSSELSPAVLIRVNGSALTLFGGLKHWGLSAPTHAAFESGGRVQVLNRTAGAVAPLAAGNLSAPWMLFWFHSGSGWHAWDSPWLVVWQHRPNRIVLDNDGLHARSNRSLGTVISMPLFGLYKPDTSRWQRLPENTVGRCRYWSRALREYPVSCTEDFRIDSATDSVVVRDRFQWVETADDWHTRPINLAPLSPTLALAIRGGRMPVTISAPIKDPGLFTAYGPYVGVENRSEYTIHFPVLHYVTQTEQDQAPARDPVTQAALRRLQTTLDEAFSSPDGLFHQDFGDPDNFSQPPPQRSDGGNTCWALMAAQYVCQALPYLSPESQARARTRLHRYFADWVLQPERFKPFRGKMLLFGPGIGAWGGYDDAGKFSSNSVITLWSYARATGDWALIRQRWPLILKLFVTPRESTWRGYGRDTIAEMGDEAAPALAMARLAYIAGDHAEYAYAAYVFARELVHHVVKHTGASYFVSHQPIHSDQPMPANVFLTNLWGDAAGWQIDGPTYPKDTGERQYTNRWVRFGDRDVARFQRDHLQDLDRAELDGLLASGRFTSLRKGPVDDPHILPSMVRLRSLLLDEPPAQLARITPVDAPLASTGGAAAYCLSFLRTSHPVHFETLIPATGAASGWQRGLEQDRPEDEPVLDVAVSATGTGPPALSWWGWTPPAKDPRIPGGDRWSFGQIEIPQAQEPGILRRLSWNSTAVCYP